MTHRAPNSGLGEGDSFAVVGGGISGIATAYLLTRAGLNVELVEKSDSLGGRLGLTKLGSQDIAVGGKNIGQSYRLFRRFVEQFGGVNYELFGINSTKVTRNGAYTLDSQNGDASLTKFLADLPDEKVERFKELLASIGKCEANRYLGSAFFEQLAREHDNPSVASFFGPELCDRIVRSMTVRMNGAESDEIYLSSFGTNIGMLTDSYEQPQGTFKEVLARFAQTIRVHTDTEVVRLLHDGDRVEGLELGSGERRWLRRGLAGVVLATPAPITAQLVDDAFPELASHLRNVRYFPVKVVVARYRRPIFPAHKRAIVFGAGTPLSNAGAYGVQDLGTVRYTFSGRAARERVAEQDDEELTLLAEKTLSRYLPVDGRERTDITVGDYPVGLCAYTRNYSDFSGKLRELLAPLTNLYLAGDYLRGASIEACFRSADDCVREITVRHKVIPGSAETPTAEVSTAG